MEIKLVIQKSNLLGSFDYEISRLCLRNMQVIKLIDFICYQPNSSEKNVEYVKRNLICEPFVKILLTIFSWVVEYSIK